MPIKGETRMKKVLLFPLLLVASMHCNGQDTITMKDKRQLDVKIIEQTPGTVRYKMPDYEDGPILTLKTRRIREIAYRNGFIDMMGYQNPRKEMPLGAGAGYAVSFTGGSLLSAAADYFVTPQIDLEINFGASDFSGGLYYSAGSRFHFSSKYSEHKLTPFSGVLGGAYYGDAIIQVPLGLHYLSGSGLNASLSVNEMISFEDWQITFIELRLGWRFRL